MSLEALSAMAFKKSVEILLVLDVGAMKRTEFKNKYFGEITFDVGLQVVEPATGKLIVSSNDSDNVRLPASAMADAERNTISESRVRQLASQVAESALGHNRRLSWRTNTQRYPLLLHILGLQSNRHFCHCGDY